MDADISGQALLGFADLPTPAYERIPPRRSDRVLGVLNESSGWNSLRHGILLNACQNDDYRSGAVIFFPVL
ncbi:hypothetical protein ACFCV3_32020 [Kribbella sp. NPDC056345]|uniref:hypothetical protein n=1 Tax=Kribbella sp. NPDC056345 TaxID=3345789 RepID=UPI0035D91A11